MSSAFEAAWRARQGVLDAKLGEAFTHVPMARPSGDARARPGPDATRARATFVGIYVEVDATMHAHGRNIADKTARAIEGERPTVDVIWPLIGTMPDGTSAVLDVRADDLVLRQGPGTTHQVVIPQPDDCGRATIKLA